MGVPLAWHDAIKPTIDNRMNPNAEYVAYGNDR